MNLYDNIEQVLRQHEETLRIENNVQESDIRHAIRWVMRDNPDIFWFVHQYHFDKDNGIVSFRYRCSPERSAIIQESINDVVEKDFQINEVITMTQLEQVAYVYKWMLTYCNYNVNSAYNQNIDSVFVRRNSVCTGYAKAAQYLFKLLGIETLLVFGRLNNDKEDGRHCWNIVCIEGIYYHLDVCMGDIVLEDVMKKTGCSSIRRYGDYNYNYFCVSTEEILKTRLIEDVETLPPCDRTLPTEEIERLSRIVINERNGVVGCQLTHFGSSADIYLCSRDKNVVLKKFRDNDSQKCEAEYGYMNCLKECKHLLQLNDIYSNVGNNILAVEQSTSVVDLYCSHYYHPTLHGLLKMINDITLGWLECQQQGILYRDIHICNIYKSNDGRYKLGDFGSCTHEHRDLRERVGNPWFMSPETCINGQFDERSAVYSISAVLYFVLNGLRPPFVDGHEEEDALQRKMNGESFPDPILLHSFHKDLAESIMIELLARGCAFYPSKRIQTCEELLHIIDAIRSTIKNQRIELGHFQKDTETILNNKTIPNVYISREIHHRFAYGEEVERIAISRKFSQYSEDVERTAKTAAFINNNGEVDNGLIPMSDDVENYCRTIVIGGPSFKGSQRKLAGEKYFITDTFEPNAYHTKSKDESTFSIWKRLFRRRESSCDVFSSIFAPAEVKRKSHMLVQLYLHLFDETEKVKALAKESDKNAERRGYTPLQHKLKKGDKVDALLDIYGETLLMSDKKSVIWQGSFTKCSFDYFVPNDIDVDELSCVSILTVNDIPIGEMRFITRIVETPRILNPEIIAHKYNKVFISYAHKDEAKVKSFHEGLKLAGIEHFFDRAYLKAGDVFPQVIQDYINSADLFVLFWSENASKSEYVDKERKQALKRAFPQVRPQQEAKLSIYPMSIEPRTELPSDMKDKYHFGEI